jgi:hypothetical protein
MSTKSALLALALFIIASSAHARDFFRAKTIVTVSYTSVQTGTVKLLKMKGKLIISNDQQVCQINIRQEIIPCQYSNFGDSIVDSEALAKAICQRLGDSCAPITAAMSKVIIYIRQRIGGYLGSVRRNQLHTEVDTESYHIDFDTSRLKKI